MSEDSDSSDPDDIIVLNISPDKENSNDEKQEEQISASEVETAENTTEEVPTSLHYNETREDAAGPPSDGFDGEYRNKTKGEEHEPGDRNANIDKKRIGHNQKTGETAMPSLPDEPSGASPHKGEVEPNDQNCVDKIPTKHDLNLFTKDCVIASEETQDAATNDTGTEHYDAVYSIICSVAKTILSVLEVVSNVHSTRPY